MVGTASGQAAVDCGLVPSYAEADPDRGQGQGRRELVAGHLPPEVLPPG